MAHYRSSATLVALGISPRSEELYRAVLSHPGSTCHILADRTGRSVEEVRKNVTTLVERGLVTVESDRIRAEPPQLALGRLLAKEARQLVVAEEALAQVRLDVSHYEVEHQAGLMPDGHALGVQLVEPAETRSVLNDLARSTVGEMLFLRPSQWRTDTSRSTDETVTHALLEGRASRAIYPTEATHQPGSLHADRMAAGERVRILPGVPCRMAVFGDEAVVLPRTLDGPAVTAVVVRQPGMVAVCRGYFEELWRHGVELAAAGQKPADLSRVQLLDLLARGVKDERIARTVGLSLRTVRRRIAELLVELGVDSRFQAGAEAVRRGWL